MRTRWVATDARRQARTQAAFISILDMGATEDIAWGRAARHGGGQRRQTTSILILLDALRKG